MDYYADDMSQFNNHGNYDKLVALNKPFGLAEVGANRRSGFDNMIILDAIKESYPETIYTMHWSGWTNLGILQTKRAIIENQNTQMFMNDPAVVTLDKVKR